MRRGEMVAHVATVNTSREDLAELMVGRKVRLTVDKEDTQAGDVLLQADKLRYVDGSGVERIKSVSFKVRAGEVVGIAGVSGNGQSELLELLSGIIKPASGSFSIGSHQIDANNPADASEIRDYGLGHVPEDRHKMGLINKFSAQEAFIMGYHNHAMYNRGLLQDKNAILRDCQEKMDKWDVRPANPQLKTANFSGGNQQKLVIAREVEKNPDVLLIGQPTRGVDIGAIEFIHKQVIAMRDAGKAVWFLSSWMKSCLYLIAFW
jgi:simple sugar transport system ATP-binding protein